MKKWREIFRFENLISKMKLVGKRFPVSVSLIIAVCIIFIFLLHGNQTSSLYPYLWKFALSFIIMFFLSVSVSISIEDLRPKAKYRDLLLLFPAVFGGLFFLSLSPNINDIENIFKFLILLF